MDRQGQRLSWPAMPACAKPMEGSGFAEIPGTLHRAPSLAADASLKMALQSSIYAQASWSAGDMRCYMSMKAHQRILLQHVSLPLFCHRQAPQWLPGQAARPDQCLPGRLSDRPTCGLRSSHGSAAPAAQPRQGSGAGQACGSFTHVMTSHVQQRWLFQDGL